MYRNAAEKQREYYLNKYKNNLDFREKAKLRSTIYHYNNKEQIQEKHKQNIVMCLCGKNIQKRSFKSHLHSKKHKINLKKILKIST